LVDVEADAEVEVDALAGSASSAMSPCASCAGHAFLLIRIFRHGFVAEPVRWQIHTFLLLAVVVLVAVVADPLHFDLPLLPFGVQLAPVVVAAVEDAMAPLFLPLPLSGGGPFATATDAATPAANSSVVTNAFSFTGLLRLGRGCRAGRCFRRAERAPS
jgi:hypothetical protein